MTMTVVLVLPCKNPILQSYGQFIRKVHSSYKRTL